jgi:hypothetical protein
LAGVSGKINFIVCSAGVVATIQYPHHPVPFNHSMAEPLLLCKSACCTSNTLPAGHPVKLSVRPVLMFPGFGIGFI